jgi:hypothetical protein
MLHGATSATSVVTEAILPNMCEPSCNAATLHKAEDRTKRVRCLGGENIPGRDGA